MFFVLIVFWFSMNFLSIECESDEESDRYECNLIYSLVLINVLTIFLFNFSVLLTDIEQLYPEQSPIGYYDKYDISKLANYDKNAIQLPKLPADDFSSHLQDIVFDPNFRVKPNDPLLIEE